MLPGRDLPASDAGEDREADQPRRRLVVGLGNPGRRYDNTPHNLGFRVVDRLSERNSVRISKKECDARVGQGFCGAHEVVLAKPQTFMNLSGPSVKSLVTKYEFTAAELILVYDELALPWTGVRIRYKGSSGGHNGVESVIRSLGTMDFARIRLGIHPGHPVLDGKKFVLAPFRRAQKKELDELLDYASGAVESMIAEGVEKAMTKFNRRAFSQDEEAE